MKVLHLLKTSEGGAWALRLMKELVKLGVEVHVALPLGGKWLPEYEQNGIIIHEYNCSIMNLKNSIRSLRHIVDKVKPDIIHSHFVLTTIIMRLGLRSIKTPRIFEVPGPLHLEHWHTRLIDLMSSQKNDYWIATCQWTKNRYLKSGIPENRVFLTYYGGDRTPREYQSGKLFSEFNIPKDSFIVGMVAYMYAPKKYLGQKRGLKGHEDFIDAISIVSAEYPDIVGVCVGGAWNNAGKYEESVKEYAHKRKAPIVFTGTRRDVKDLYQDFSCVVHPSHSENLGGAGESLSLGVPTISTNVGGFPDIVINGKTGLLVNPKRPEEIAEAIKLMYLDRKFAYESGQKGKALVTDLLDVRNTSRSVFNFYNTILNNSFNR